MVASELASELPKATPSEERKLVEPSSLPTNDNSNDNSNPQQGNFVNIPKGNQPPTQQGKIENADNPQQQLNGGVKVPATRKDERKLFVGGLPSNVTDQEFRTFFEQFGEISDSVVMFDRDTRRSRGFGFVTFVDPEVSKSLLKMGGGSVDGVGRLNMHGKTCEVKAAQPKDPGHPGQINNHNRGKHDGRGGHHHAMHGNKNDPAHVMPPYHYHHYPYPPYPTDPMVAASPPQDTIPAFPGGPYQGFPPHAMTGCMAPMYYPTAIPTNGPMVPPSVPGAPMGDYMSPFPAYYMGQGHPPAVPMDASHMQMQQQEGAPIAQAVPQTTAAANGAAQAYAFIPFMMAAPMAQGPPAGVPQQPTSMMQPVAPGLPLKDGAMNDDGAN